MGTGEAAWLSVVFVLVLAVSAGCEVDCVVRFARSGTLSTTAGSALTTTSGAAGASPAPAAPRRLAPGLEAASHVAMCLVIAYMLVVMG